MEFDNTTTPVRDEQRRLAESKKITLQPVHDNIQPEDTPDSEIASRHLADPLISNNSVGDSEDSSSAVQPSKGVLSAHDDRAAMRITAIATGSVIVITVGIFVFL